MRLLRVGPLPDSPLEAAARFHAQVVPDLLNLPPAGEGDHAKHGGGALSQHPRPAVPGNRPVPLYPRPAAGALPLRLGEDLLLIFPPASHEHAAWRLSVVQDLARAAVPCRVNGVAGDDEQAIAQTVAFLERSPGVTGQLLAV